MRNPTLHGLLSAFIADAAARLEADRVQGGGIPFEVVQADGGGGRVPLYCYRPLTGDFIRRSLGLLVALPSYVPVAQALETAEGTDNYLRARGESRVPERPRDRADGALRLFLQRVFHERTEFGFDPGRFGQAYEELEHALYQGRCVVEVVAPLLGVALDSATDELRIGDGLSLVRRSALPDPPDEAVLGSPGAEDHPGPGDSPDALLIVLRVAQERSERAPISMARSRFRRTLTALRLFERGAYALGPVGWTRVDDGAWRPVALGASGRARLSTVIPAAQEDELRAFCNLIARRLPAPSADSSGSGELAWALSRFEMACERVGPFEALTDHLLALRALLEPEGPSSGRLAQRLAVICAPPQERTQLAERVAHAISLERAVIAGVAPARNGPAHPADRLVDEIADHLRAILRDVLCGHLDVDVRAVADDLLAEAAEAAESVDVADALPV